MIAPIPSFWITSDNIVESFDNVVVVVVVVGTSVVVVVVGTSVVIALANPVVSAKLA